MRIIKISASHLVTDPTKEVYEREFAPLKAKRNAMIAEATKSAEALGHRLFRNWTAGFNSNRCRKCGMTVSLPNVYGKFACCDAVGQAVTARCEVHLDDADWTFDITDKILDSGVPLNRDQLTAIASKPAKQWKNYLNIPSFVRGQDLAGAFEGIYGKKVEEYCDEHLPEMGLKELAMRLGSDLGFEVKVSRGILVVNVNRQQAYEKAFPRDSGARERSSLPMMSDDELDAIVNGNDDIVTGGTKATRIRSEAQGMSMSLSQGQYQDQVYEGFLGSVLKKTTSFLERNEEIAERIRKDSEKGGYECPQDYLAATMLPALAGPCREYYDGKGKKLVESVSQATLHKIDDYIFQWIENMFGFKAAGGTKMRIVRLSESYRFPSQCPNCSYVNVCHKNTNKQKTSVPATVAPPIKQVTDADSPVAKTVDEMIDEMLHGKKGIDPAARDPHEESECGDFIPKDFERRNTSRSY